MNATNLRLVADVIERSESYDQGTWAHKCGTPGCIAGHAAYLQLAPGESMNDDGDILVDGKPASRPDVRACATTFLDMNVCEASDAFALHPDNRWPEPFASEWIDAGKAMHLQRNVAVRYLRHLADEADKAAP